MPRYIDADALIDDIRKHSESYFADDFAHEWVDKQPSADVQPVRNWIPVSKDLPKTPIRVQVQLDNNWIITAYYDEGEWYDVPGDGEPIDGVLAWMPLPDPYKEERKDDEQIRGFGL